MSETGIIIGNAIVWGIGLVELAFLAKVGVTALIRRHHAIEMSKRVMAESGDKEASCVAGADGTVIA